MTKQSDSVRYEDGGAAGRALAPGLQASIFLRSLALQASWNPQRMQNLGLLGALIPWLRRRGAARQERRRFCRRHYGFFNTNPYLAGFVLGGLLRLEDQGEAGRTDGDLLRGYKDSLGRTFAALGDQLFWLGLQPGVLLLGGLLALLLGPWPALILCAAFALAMLGLRHRSLAVGYRLGLDIVELLDHPGWHRLIRRSQQASLLLAGAWTACWLAGLGRGADIGGAAALGLALAGGVALPLILRKRSPGEGFLLLALPLALILSYL